MQNYFKPYDLILEEDEDKNIYQELYNNSNMKNDKAINVSKDSNSGKVMAWIIDDPNNTGYYKLYIGNLLSDSYISPVCYDVNGDECDMYIHIKFATKIPQILAEASNYFDIKNATDMVGMFYRCSNEFKNKIRSKFKNINNDAFEKAFH